MSNQPCNCAEVVGLRQSEDWLRDELTTTTIALGEVTRKLASANSALERLRSLRAKLATEVELYEAHCNLKDHFGVRASAATTRGTYRR